ncbi:MAG: YfcE family phosphodiesterase [Planctomycetota bacterium]
MRIGVISDTHGHADLTQRGVRMLVSLEAEVVLHCGDIGSAEVVAQFHPFPTHFVFGNCDHDRAPLVRAIADAGQACHDEFGKIELAGVRIGLLHSHDKTRFRNALASGGFGLVCYGHTHLAAIDHHGETLALNPGAVYRANPHSVAVVELPSREATIIDL